MTSSASASTTTVTGKREHDEISKPNKVVVNFTEEDRRNIAKELARPLTAMETQTKNKQPYIEGFRAWELANQIFGFGGWSCSVRELTVVHVSTRVVFEKRSHSFFFPSVGKCLAASGKRLPLPKCA